MPDDTITLLGRVAGGESLSFDEMAAAINAIMDGTWSSEQIALLLTALSAKGETVSTLR